MALRKRMKKDEKKKSTFALPWAILENTKHRTRKTEHDFEENEQVQ